MQDTINFQGNEMGTRKFMCVIIVVDVFLFFLRARASFAPKSEQQWRLNANFKKIQVQTTVVLSAT
jgi:hypothetical protein